MRERPLFGVGSMALLACTLVVAVYFVAPIHESPGSVLVGTAPFPYDALLNAGVLEWEFRSIWEHGGRVFEWNAGFPIHNALAGTENLVGWQLFYSPLRLIGVGVPGAYNVTLLSSLVLSGIGAALLARKLGAGTAGALLAAIAFAFNPFHINHAIHLQSMAICWAPFAFLFLESYLETGRSRFAALFGIATLITLLSGLYLGVMLTMMSVCYALLSLHRASISRRKLLAGLSAALFCVIIASLPVTWHYVEFAQRNGWYHWKAETLARFSLNLGAFFRVPAWLSATQQTPLAAKGLDTQTPAFPGFVVLALATYALSRRKDATDPRFIQRTNTLVWCTIISIVLALGPFLKLRSQGPIGWLEWLPMPGKLWLAMPGIRWPMRIYLFASLTMAMLAGIGLGRLSMKPGPRGRSIVAIAAIALLLVELRPATVYSREAMKVSEPLAMSDAYAFLAAEKDTGAVAEIPSADERGYSTPMLTRYVYGSSGHLRRIVAYHGNLIPQGVERLRAAIDSLPSRDALTVLESSGVTRIVLHRDLMPREAAERFVRDLPLSGARLLFDRGQSVVFALGQRH